MENPQKPTRNHEQEQRKTLRDYVVATFHADLDIVKRPLTVIRSGKDKEDVIYEGGWVPSAMLCVCNTDPEKGAGPTELFVEVYKTIKVNGERVPVTGIAPLNILRNLKENGVFTESYILALYGKSTEEMLKEGAEAAEQIWRQKHPDSEWNELLDVKAPSETPSDGLDTEGNSEESLRDEVSPAMGNLAIKTVEVSPVKTDKAGANPADLAATEPAKKPVETGRVSISPSTLVMSKKVLESIGAVKVDDSVGSPAIKSAAVKELAKNIAVASAKELVVDSIKNPAVKLSKKPAEIDKVGTNPADLVATEPVEKPVEADKASTDSVNLPAAKSVKNPVAEKSMETNETNADILPERFKDTINRFKQLTEENNGKFFAKAQYITGELNQLRRQIQINPAVIYGLNSEEFMKGVSNKIRDLEDSRAEDTNKFKNDVSDLIEELKKKIENDDERSRLVKLTEHVDQMGENNIVLGNVTNDLLDKLIRIRRYIAKSQNDRGGIVHYKSNITQVIGEIINDLSIASGRRRGIVGGIEGIKSEGYHQKR